METIYDWIAVAAFCALALLYLQRSVGQEVHGDHVLHYLPPAIGCAGVNWLGNGGQPVLAFCLLAAIVAYVLLVLRPGRGAP